MRAYHFLSSEHGLNDIALKRIRISRYGDLNDPFELFAGDLGEPRLRSAVRKLKAHWDSTQGILCFSRDWTNPVLWSHYALKHRGACLAFELNDKFVNSVEYVDSRIPLDDLTGQSQERALACIEKLVLSKFHDWKYEDEVRMVVRLDEGTAENGMFFYSFSKDLALKEVFLGPLCEVPIDSVKGLIESLYPGDGVLVHKTRLAFKRFAVVLDQRHEDGG